MAQSRPSIGKAIFTHHLPAHQATGLLGRHLCPGLQPNHRSVARSGLFNRTPTLNLTWKAGLE